MKESTKKIFSFRRNSTSLRRNAEGYHSKICTIGNLGITQFDRINIYINVYSGTD